MIKRRTYKTTKFVCNACQKNEQTLSVILEEKTLRGSKAGEKLSPNTENRSFLPKRFEK